MGETVKIMPCLDMKDGRVVKGVPGGSPTLSGRLKSVVM